MKIIGKKIRPKSKDAELMLTRQKVGKLSKDVESLKEKIKEISQVGVMFEFKICDTSENEILANGFIEAVTIKVAEEQVKMWADKLYTDYTFMVYKPNFDDKDIHIINCKEHLW